MSATTNDDSDPRRYKLLVLCGHPGSGKSTLAAHYARQQTPPARVISIRRPATEFLASLVNVDAQQFEHPRGAGAALQDDDGAATTYNMLLDDFYNSTRSVLPWHIWAAAVQCQILAELRKADGARCFVVDDVVHRDECEFLMILPDGGALTLFLDGNPGEKLPLDTNHPAYHTRQDIRDHCAIGVFSQFRLVKNDTKATSPEHLVELLDAHVRTIERHFSGPTQ